MKIHFANVTGLMVLAAAALSIGACETKKPAVDNSPVVDQPVQQTLPPRQTEQPPVRNQPQQTPPITQNTLPPQTSGVGPGTVQDFVINAGDRIFFDLNSYSVRADAEPVLNAQAAWLARYPQVTVRIEGNADERGTREYNFALGERRASAVRDYLMRRGVAGGRIEIISYGKERPIDEGSNESAWARNRNGHTTITGGAR